MGVLPESPISPPKISALLITILRGPRWGKNKRKSDWSLAVSLALRLMKKKIIEEQLSFVKVWRFSLNKEPPQTGRKKKCEKSSSLCEFLLAPLVFWSKWSHDPNGMFRWKKKPFHGHSSFGGACPVASSVCQKIVFFFRPPNPGKKNEKNNI